MTKIIGKIKKIPLPVIFLSVFVFLLIVIIISIVIPGKKAKTTISGVVKQQASQPSQSGQTQDQQSGQTGLPSFPSAIEAEQQEKKYLEEQKKYLGKVEPLAPQSPKEKENIEQKVKEIVDKSNKKEEPSYKMTTTATPSGPTTQEEKTRAEKEQINERAKLFQYFLSYTGNPVGKRLGTGSLQNNENRQPSINTQKTETLPFEIYKEKPYLAKLLTTVSSLQQNQRVYAEIQEAPLKGIKISGKASYTDATERINVIFDTLIYNNKKYPIKAYAYSIDKTAGIVSHVKYNTLAKIQSIGAAAFVEKMLDALREDETVTTQTLFSLQTETRKSPNRLREGLLAGGSAAFSEIKNALSQSYSKVPDKEIFAEKGTPIYVIFEE